MFTVHLKYFQDMEMIDFSTLWSETITSCPGAYRICYFTHATTSIKQKKRRPTDLFYTNLQLVYRQMGECRYFNNVETRRENESAT